VVVRAGDGTSYDEQELKVVVEDVDEAPLFYSYWGDAHVALTMGENTLATFAVSAKDPDQNSWVTYGLEGPDADLFTVDPYEGGLSLSQALDFEAPADADGDNVYEVTVVAYSGAFSATQAFSITIADDYEPVTITSDGGGTAASLSVPENDAAVTVVHASGDGFITYQIVGGTDASYFKIDPYTGAVEFVVAPDYEGTRRAAGGRPHSGEPPIRFTEPGLHGNTYDLLVRASNGSSFDDQRLTINVTNVDEAPVILSYSGQASVALTLFENATSIGSLIAADPDGTPVTFAIAGGADAALFAVDPAGGALRFKQGPDFEVPADAGGDNVYQVSVVASSGTLSAAQSFSITIRDVNENVTITSNGGGDAAAVAVAENLTALTTVAASGPGAVTFSIVGGADAADFTIDASTGALAFAQAPNFEGTADTDHDNVYEVIVRASNGSTSDDQLLSVNLANVDETPDFFDHVEGVIELSTIENRSYVGDLLAFDVDGGPAITYSIAGGADGALFAIDPVTGSLSLLNASGPDFEAPADSDGDNVYEVEVTATAGAWSRTRAFAVTVDDQNEVIVITSNGGGTSVSISMDEGGNYVTTIVGHDPDGTAPAYSIIGGPDAARFTIDSATGVLSFVDRPDFEAPADSGGANFYTVQVEASDGQSLAWQTVQVRVGNVNEPLAITSSGGGSSASVAVSENGRGVAVVAAADPDGASPTFSIAGGADASRFTIDAQTGALQFVSAPDREAPADANADNVYDVVVRASDGTFFDDQALSVTVGNVDEGVDLVSYGGQATIFLTLGENGVSVGQVAGRDQDGDPVTYAIAGGADAGRFRVDAGTGALSFISSPDFEAPAHANWDNVYKVEVAAIAGAFSAVQAFAVTVANVNEGLSITSNGGGSSALVWVGENSRAVTSVAAIDADGTAATYSIVGGADASRFTIDPQTGALQFVAAPDFELPADADGDNVYSVVVQAGDGQFTDSQALSVAVANLRDGNNVAGTTGGDAISGTSSNPELRTSNSEDTVFGRDGNDTISGLGGDDYLYGDAGNDNLAGGAGADRLTGGAGKDEFIYNLASESTAVSRDVITDFSHAQNDRINLSAIDANTNLVNNQAFTFIGSAAFSHVAGQLRFEQIGGNTFVSGDVNGDGVADFQIELTGSITPVASDFAL
jgi:Ca2+-binding RTX toxin-like protein